MTRYDFQDIQHDVVDDIYNGNAPTLITHGPTQCGKTNSTVYGFMGFVTRWSGMDFGIITHTARQLKGILRYVYDFCEDFNLEWRSRGEFYELSGMDGRAPNRIFCITANDKSAEWKIRSFTFAGILVDELTTIPYDVIPMAMSRLSVPGALFCGTTNPDNPLHRVKTDLIEDPDNIEYPFGLWDNPTMTQEYEDRITKGFAKGSTEYKRMVLGMWVAHEGNVFPFFKTTTEDRNDQARHTIGSDWASSGMTAAIMTARYDHDDAVVIREFARTGVASEDYDEMVKAQELRAELCNGIIPYHVCVDPSAPKWRGALQAVTGWNVNLAQNDVNVGIQWLNKRFHAQELVIHERCEGLLKELSNYMWDEKYRLMGIDKPIKKNDHRTDSLRYDELTYTYYAEGAGLEIVKFR